MKKLLFLITLASAVGAACVFVGGCGERGNQGGDNKPLNDLIRQENEKTDNDNGCNGGDCEEKDFRESMPEFEFRPRLPQGEEERETENDGENTARHNIDPVRPHKVRPHKKRPMPKPMPEKPEK